jgi:hypothetical protein
MTLTAENSVKSVPHQQQDLNLTIGGSSNNGDGGNSNDICHQSGGLTACAGKGYIICDGFEDSLDFQPPWYVEARPDPQSAMTIASAPPPPCRGMHSAHSHAVGANQDVYIGQHPATSIPAEVTQRMFLYLPSSSPALEIGLLAFFLDPQGDQMILGLLNDSAFQLYRSFGTDISFSATIPRDRWFCLETTVHFGDASSGRIRVYIDEQQVRDQAVATVGANGIFNTVFAGVHLTPPNFAGAYDLYMDEFVLAGTSTPIGCH